MASLHTSTKSHTTTRRMASHICSMDCMSCGFTQIWLTASLLHPLNRSGTNTRTLSTNRFRALNTNSRLKSNMPDYRVVYDIAQAGYNGWTSLGVLFAFVLVG